MLQRTGGNDTFIVVETSRQSNPVIYGTIYNSFDQKPLPLATIKVDNKKPYYKTDQVGSFKFSVLPGKHSFTGTRVGFIPFTTRSINMRSGDSIRLKMYLNEYSKPLVD